MEGFLVLRSSLGYTKAVLEVVNGFFDGGAYFIGIFPLGGATEDAWVSAEVLFGIYVKHTAARGIGTGVVAGSPAFEFAINLDPLHFGANEFHGREFAAQM